MPELTPEILTQAAAGMLVLGLLLCFLGYRIFLPALAFGGFAVGAVAGGAGGLLLAEDSFAALIAALAAGSVAAILFVAFYGVVLCFGGAVSGFFLAAAAVWLSGAEWGAPAVAALVAGVVIGGISALMLQRLVIIGSSAAKGAFFTVAGGWFLLQRARLTPLLLDTWNAIAKDLTHQTLTEALSEGFDLPPILRDGLSGVFDQTTLAFLLVAFVGTAVLGMAVHYTITARARPENGEAT